MKKSYNSLYVLRIIHFTDCWDIDVTLFELVDVALAAFYQNSVSLYLP